MKRTTIYLDEDTHEYIRQAAFEAREAMAAWIRRVLEEKVGKLGKVK